MEAFCPPRSNSVAVHCECDRAQEPLAPVESAIALARTVCEAAQEESSRGITKTACVEADSQRVQTTLRRARTTCEAAKEKSAHGTTNTAGVDTSCQRTQTPLRRGMTLCERGD
jgi:hypothetical protein